MHVGLHPLLDGDPAGGRADFDGTAAMLDALNYVKAACAGRANRPEVPLWDGACLDVLHGPGPAETARPGTGLL
jgi:hypothetical protein